MVEPHYVLTCRHVVDDLTLGRADKIELIDPTDNNHRRRLAATCVAVGEEDDLCLLRCDQLNAPSITLADKVPPRGTEILLMGFPGGSWFGLGLKTTARRRDGSSGRRGTDRRPALVGLLPQALVRRGLEPRRQRRSRAR